MNGPALRFVAQFGLGQQPKVMAIQESSTKAGPGQQKHSRFHKNSNFTAHRKFGHFSAPATSGRCYSGGNCPGGKCPGGFYHCPLIGEVNKWK